VGTGSSVFRTAFTASTDCAYAESVGVTMRARRFLRRPDRHRIDRAITGRQRVARAVDANISGEPLDAEAERAAQRSGWR
jgi:hypothetical protein